jgi:hypothetical protein
MNIILQNYILVPLSPKKAHSFKSENPENPPDKILAQELIDIKKL